MSYNYATSPRSNGTNHGGKPPLLTVSTQQTSSTIPTGYISVQPGTFLNIRKSPTEADKKVGQIKLSDLTEPVTNAKVFDPAHYGTSS